MEEESIIIPQEGENAATVAENVTGTASPEVQTAAENTAGENQNALSGGDGRIERGIRGFISRYPGVKAQDIPMEVWEKVRGGEELADAYTRWENGNLKGKIEELTRQIDTLRQKEENDKRALGSRAGAGSAGGDKWFEGWDE